MKKQKLVREFLLDKGESVLNKYISNIDPRLIETMTNSSNTFIIVNAFDWSKSPEGYEYWKVISDEWIKLCSSGGI